MARYLLWATCGLAMVIGVTAIAARKNSWRYKMTVEVQTPEGLRSGWAVREVTYKANNSSWFALGESRPQWRVKGQAIVIDLPNDKSLYALLSSASGIDEDHGARIADRAVGDGGRVSGRRGAVELYPRHPNTPGLARTNPLPMLVTFANPADARSVEPIDPHNLHAAFGPGYALKGITLEIVDEPITIGIERRLPNFGKGSGYSEWYRSLKYGDLRRIGPEDFNRRP